MRIKAALVVPPRKPKTTEEERQRATKRAKVRFPVMKRSPMMVQRTQQIDDWAIIRSRWLWRSMKVPPTIWVTELVMPRMVENHPA